MSSPAYEKSVLAFVELDPQWGVDRILKNEADLAHLNEEMTHALGEWAKEKRALQNEITGLKVALQVDYIELKG